ncbi:MKRN2 opposite strand protein-like [Elysia marginata]|uniref:MKRN2 opposite strand protein-like n=1 Tax=Elysia marginata TaxID=1093978 RepID=A0AAV4IGW8_9GAST|nr:MKRN2 opposite strand protein-like [Elysia marginata]
MDSSLTQQQQQLRCFQHCRKDIDLVCFRLPELCPLCREDTARTPCRIPPYVLPSPFVSSEAAPRSVVVRPTLGTFISEYSSVCDLHIGLTDSAGHVTEFDERGLTVGSVWPQCLVVLTCPRSPQQPSHRLADMMADSNRVSPPLRGSEAWDLALSQLSSVQSCARLWERSRYNEQTWNCFDLVLHFLSKLREETQQELLGSDFNLTLMVPGETRRSEFCNRFLVDKCRRAGDYVLLYRRVMAEGCVCVPRQGREGTS